MNRREMIAGTFVARLRPSLPWGQQPLTTLPSGRNMNTASIGGVSTERRGHVFLIGLDRPRVENRFDPSMYTTYLPALMCSQLLFAVNLAPSLHSEDLSEFDEGGPAHAIGSTSRCPRACQ